MQWHGSAADIIAALAYDPVNNPLALSIPFVNISLTGLVDESSADGITAHAGGGQAGATQIATEIVRVTTVATAGDSVKLPPTTGNLNLTIAVINGSANPMQVYGYGTDTINGVATATGVSQMQGSVVIYVSPASGVWVAEGLGTGVAGSLPTVSAANALTAHAGGGQASATPITTVLTRVTTVASANDSTVLPASAAGLELTVTNAAATNSMNVFPAGTDQINTLGASAAFALAAGKTVTFFCSVAGQWHSILSA